MKKKLDTRFPAARIKKIMQADEDVGKIAMAVPLLVSKALELFLQDLCDRTYGITLQKGVKTLNSLHLKQCVKSFNVFDFLRDIVNRVPDLGGSEGAGEERSATKRRKVADDDHIDGDEDSNKDKPPETVQTNGSSRGRGRPRGRGRGKICQAEKEANTVEDVDSKGNHISAFVKTENEVKVRNFDLNLDLDENGDTPPAVIPPCSSPKPVLEIKPDESFSWSLADVENMAIDPVQFSNLNSRVDEDDEDYDEEE